MKTTKILVALFVVGALAIGTTMSFAKDYGYGPRHRVSKTTVIVKERYPSSHRHAYRPAPIVLPPVYRHFPVGTRYTPPPPVIEYWPRPCPYYHGW